MLQTRKVSLVDTFRIECAGGDSNPQAVRHTPLERTCIPFHHLRITTARPLYPTFSLSSNDSKEEFPVVFFKPDPKPLKEMPLPKEAIYGKSLRKHYRDIHSGL